MKKPVMMVMIKCAMKLINIITGYLLKLLIYFYYVVFRVKLGNLFKFGLVESEIGLGGSEIGRIDLLIRYWPSPI